MPRAFLVKKRGPARRPGPGVGLETSPTSSKEYEAVTHPHTTSDIVSEKDLEVSTLERPPTVEELFPEDEGGRPGGERDGTRSTGLGYGEPRRTPSPRTPASGDVKDRHTHNGKETNRAIWNGSKYTILHLLVYHCHRLLILSKLIMLSNRL